MTETNTYYVWCYDWRSLNAINEFVVLNGEIFGTHRNCHGYLVGSLGTVYTCWRNAGRYGQWICNRWKRMHPDINRDRPRISVRTFEMKRLRMLVAAMMLEVFVEQRPQGMEACHNDGKCWNNLLSNLRWDTPKGNQNDRFKHGTDSRGEQNGEACLTVHEALFIRHKRITENWTYADIHRTYYTFMDYSTICKIGNKQLWSHV